MIVLIIILGILLFLLVKRLLNDAELKKIFNNHNVIVYGGKGKGNL